MYQTAIIAKEKDAARLDRPPANAARAVLAPEFGRRFLVFADTEEEFDWGAPLSRAATATRAITGLTEASRRFAGRGVAPTYLVDFPVADAAESAAVLSDIFAAGEGELGAHLHPWVNPPHDEIVSGPNSFAGNLPAALERAKLLALTAKLAETFGRPPIAYRAGRYGIGPNTGRILAEAGYRLDVSVRARFDYSGEGGPDFTHFPIWPYWSGAGLLELPLTTALEGPLRRWPSLARSERLRGPLARTLLLNRVPLTPEGVSLAEAKRAIETLLERGTRVFSLSFHSPSVVPGHTPYVRDQADLDRFWAWWDGVFDLFARHGVRPARASELLAAAEA